MTFEDQEDFELCGVVYKSTRQQANEIMAIVIETTDWRNYAKTNDLLRYGTFSATDPEAIKLLEKNVENYRAAFKTAKKVIDAYLGT